MADLPMVATEVLVPGSDSVMWTQISVPLPIRPLFSESRGPASRNTGSCLSVGDPPIYIIWRIHQEQPNVLEMVEFSPCKPFPKDGLHLIFEDSLYPFAFICKNEARSKTGNIYMLYALTVSGVAYLLRLRSFSTYSSGYVFPQNEFDYFHLESYQFVGCIKGITATFGCLAIGREDGCINCFQLGIMDHNTPGFMYELRDSVGSSRIWNFIARTRVVGAVQDMLMIETHDQKLLMVLHFDGYLRVWDLLGHARVLCQSITVSNFSGFTGVQLWLADSKPDSDTVSFAILWKNFQTGEEFVVIHKLLCMLMDKINVSLESMSGPISLEEGRLVGLALDCNKVWILKEDGQMSYDLFHLDKYRLQACHHCLLEGVIARQLFRDSKSPSDDFLRLGILILLYMKNEMATSFISSAMMRKLLDPSICQYNVLRETFCSSSEFGKNFEFQSCSVDTLKRNVCDLLENEKNAGSPLSLFSFWDNVFSHFHENWCRSNIPYSVFVDFSTGAVGLVRKNSISILRKLDDIELLSNGLFLEYDANLKNILPEDDDDCAIFLELLKCIGALSQRLGESAAGFYYEAALDPMFLSPDDLLYHFMDVLFTGPVCMSNLSANLRCSTGIDQVRELEYHTDHRKFSANLMNSLREIYCKARTWDRIFSMLDILMKHLRLHKHHEILDTREYISINNSLVVGAVSQFAERVSQFAFDLLIFLRYLRRICIQVHMDNADAVRLQSKLIPLAQSIQKEWLTVYLLGTSTPNSIKHDDFTSQLSALHLDNKVSKRWDMDIGNRYSLASLLMLKFPLPSEFHSCISSPFLPGRDIFVSILKSFCSWIICGDGSTESDAFHIMASALIFVSCHQYQAVENLFHLTDPHGCKEKMFEGMEDPDNVLSYGLYIQAYCLLMQAQHELPTALKKKKICKSVCLFFSAAYMEGAYESLQHLHSQTAIPFPRLNSASVWKLQYYEWVMQIFEQYNISEAALQFALAALQEVDEVLGFNENCNSNDSSCLEAGGTVRGRLWANAFKFSLDLNCLVDAYCAIISNPDEDSKNICLRRYINILFEHDAIKALCNVELPFVGLMDQVEQELMWKAERSDVNSRPNPYKLLYAFEVHHHNWQKAAGYMYKYYFRLKKECARKEKQELPMLLQEQLDGISSAINALSIVHPRSTWIDVHCGSPDEELPSKKPRVISKEPDACAIFDGSSRQTRCSMDLEELEHEYVLAYALYCLSLDGMGLSFHGKNLELHDIVDLLLEADLFDVSFTVVVNFWSGLELKRELEHIFVVLSQKCSRKSSHPPLIWDSQRVNNALLTYGDDTDEISVSTMIPPKIQNQWDKLQFYLGWLRKLHPRLVLIVAETLLHSDYNIQLPLWLVHMFEEPYKQSPSSNKADATPDAMALFRLYVIYRRHTEATNLFFKYLESLTALRPADVINRKRMSAIWLPYTSLEQLWCQLEDMQNAGYMPELCEKLKELLHKALRRHLEQVKVDSDDTLDSVIPRMKGE